MFPHIPNKLSTSSRRNWTATNFKIVRYSSGESYEQLSSVTSDISDSLDLTEDAIPERPEVPVETAVEQVEKVLVYYLIGEIYLKTFDFIIIVFIIYG